MRSRLQGFIEVLIFIREKVGFSDIHFVYHFQSIGGTYIDTNGAPLTGSGNYVDIHGKPLPWYSFGRLLKYSEIALRSLRDGPVGNGGIECRVWTASDAKATGSAL